ncbi:LpqB family beta-propeller domain-containing protein [Actinocorallia sp. A-T 12471]|uniref:LpqB family beta-propeller domain-containing protein n=1 Tax=Actinocorallia sp. A-T 12471 TaxID=3089813 RepID=UPI0029D28588|nr:LpqB family beta-propeller domain-containing protein [Actinocorallia sp. A-T 12471]MDX6744582.1 LpqB family beta-propeller domain-containing protein [Actinocorallia sp. A-T 12471]
MRRLRPLAAGLAALVLASGCASLPTGGRVYTHTNDARTEPFDEPYVRIDPTRPKQGWTAVEVVEGYLVAMANFDNDRATFRSYLAEDVEFDTAVRPTVNVLDDAAFQGPMSVSERNGVAMVQIVGDRLGRITSSGQYVAAGAHAHDVTFTLRQNKSGEWRISYAPGEAIELVLRRSDVDRAFRTTNLYYLAPDGLSLVPDAVFLPQLNRSDLPSQLVKSLLSQTTPWLSGAVVSAFPAGTRLLGGKVALADDDVITVNLSAEAASGNVDQMSAQLMWTLGQLTEVQSLRLQIDGRTQRTSDGLEVQTLSRWSSLGPDAPFNEIAAIKYLLDGNGRLSLLQGKQPAPFPSLRSRSFRTPAVALDGREFAAVSGKSVYVGETSTGKVAEVLKAQEGATLLRPSWDRHGYLWIVQNKGSESTLWLRAPGAVRAVQVPLPNVGGQIKALRIAHDGVRVAALVSGSLKTEIQISRIAPTPTGYAVGRFHPINAELSGLVDLAWRDSDTLAVLGMSGTSSSVLPYEVPISGGAISPVGGSFEGTPVSISAAPGQAILLGVESKERDGPTTCVQTPNEEPRFSTWDCDVTGSSPTYPG